MRAVILSLLFGLMTITTTATTFAQTELDVGERIRLRELLRVSALTEFSQTPKAPLPARETLNVHLGFGLDFELRERFVGWIEEWNRKHERRYASLSVVENIETAHVILAWYPAAENILNINTYSALTPGGVYEKTATHREYYLVGFAYVILPVHRTPLHLQTIWRNQSEIIQTSKMIDSKRKGEPLWAAFFTLLKRHTKKR
jgi:hypothetical protein